jgi:eukaryotic-like serine/threonine-protein kinase
VGVADPPLRGLKRDSWELVEGDVITADLTVTRLLGGGECVEAYLAFDELTYGPVVVKLLRPGLVADPTALRALAREARILSRVNHPVVVRGLRAVLDGPSSHLVLEALDGPRLSTLVRRHGALPEEQYVRLGIELASALHYLRRVGVVHLDVQPSNVVMEAPARLIDVSVARTTDEAVRLQDTIGTRGYMSPEQRHPGRAGTPGPASDVYGLGATLHEAATGHRVSRAEHVSVRLPADVRELVRDCLSPEPADRPLPGEVAERLGPANSAAPRRWLAGLGR